VYRDGGFLEERDLTDKELKVLKCKQVTSNMITAMSSRGVCVCCMCVCVCVYVCACVCVCLFFNIFLYMW